MFTLVRTCFDYTLVFISLLIPTRQCFIHPRGISCCWRRNFGIWKGLWWWLFLDDVTGDHSGDSCFWVTFLEITLSARRRSYSRCSITSLFSQKKYAQDGSDLLIVNQHKELKRQPNLYLHMYESGRDWVTLLVSSLDTSANQYS